MIIREDAPLVRRDRLGRTICLDAETGMFDKTTARAPHRVARVRELLARLEVVVACVAREGLWTLEDSHRLNNLRNRVTELTDEVQRAAITVALNRRERSDDNTATPGAHAA